MDTGRFYIDGHDAYGEYRVFLAEGSAASLLAYPPLKKVDSTDWPEEDGVEVDLTAPRLDTRNVSLNFVSHDAGGQSGDFGRFISALSDRGYHTFRFPSLGDREYKLRLASQGSMEHWRRADVFTLQFADDFPPCCGEDYRRPVTDSSVTPCRDYSLDGRPFTDYGVRVLEGSLAEVLKSPQVKQRLLINGNGENGAWYDGGQVTYRSKDVRLGCLMRAKDFAEFWKSHEALLYDLTRPRERELHVEYTAQDYPCHYKGCASKVFAFTGGRIWWEFALTLTFISFRATWSKVKGR